MSQQTSGHAPGAAPGTPTDPTTRDPSGTEQSTTQVARDEATQVGRTGVEAGRNVVGTATEQAGEVAQEARRQARDMFEQVRGQAQDQARNGQQKATDGLRALAAELNEMAGGGDRSGPASDLAAQAASRIDAAADWLSRREPGDLLDEVRNLARRRPGAFLMGAALAGVVAGRLTRGAVDATRDTGGGGAAMPGTGAMADVPAPRPPVPGPGYPAAPPSSAPPSPGPQGAPAYPTGGSAGVVGGMPPAPPPPAPPSYQPGPPPPRPTMGGAGSAPHGQGPGGPAYPPPGYLSPGAGDQPSPGGAPGGAHAPRTEATTVGEYVEEIERGAEQRSGDRWTDPGGSR
jgi:hypothetical protein